MEIIKHGELIKTCKNCGCEFRYTKDDVRKREFCNRQDEGILLPNYKYVDYITEYVECPDCGNKIGICTYRKY